MARVDETHRINGFTSLEVLVVLIVIGIISVIIIGRSDIGQTDLLAQTEVIKSHIRFAQSRAMNSSRSWGFRCNESGQVYWLFANGQPDAQKRKLPGEESDTVDLGRYQLALTPTTLSFDDRGRPCSDAHGQTRRPNDLSLTLSAGGAVTTTLIITRNTGFVP